jgi:hypothetical protein
MKFDRYKQNLRFEYPYVYSYETKVAKVVDNEWLVVEKYYSVTTSKHINYVANQLGYKVYRKYE